MSSTTIKSELKALLELCADDTDAPPRKSRLEFAHDPPHGDTMSKYKHEAKLLQDLADGLRQLPPRTTMGCVAVILHVDDQTAFEIGGPADMLDMFINEITWDERGSWADADRLEVKTL